MSHRRKYERLWGTGGNKKMMRLRRKYERWWGIGEDMKEAEAHDEKMKDDEAQE